MLLLEWILVNKYVRSYLNWLYLTKQINILKWAVEQGCPPTDSFSRFLIKENDLEMLKYVYPYKLQISKSMTDDRTSRQIINWLDEMNLTTYLDITIRISDDTKFLGYMNIKPNTRVWKFYDMFADKFKVYVHFVHSDDFNIMTSFHMGINIYKVFRDGKVRTVKDKINNKLYYISPLNNLWK